MTSRKRLRMTKDSSLVIVALMLSVNAAAFTTTITAANPRAIYLQVGVGGFTGTYNGGGTPGNNTTVNLVSVAVPAASIGTGVAQPMTTNSTAANSPYDNYAFCTTPAQLYVGGFYRFNSNTAGTGATLTATSPASLINGSGDTIPFTEISWTSTGAGDTGTQAFPAGTFNGGTQTIGTIARNQWAESCHTFSFANTAMRAAGTYSGRVTYTLTAP